MSCIPTRRNGKNQSSPIEWHWVFQPLQGRPLGGVVYQLKMDSKKKEEGEGKDKINKIDNSLAKLAKLIEKRPKLIKP